MTADNQSNDTEENAVNNNDAEHTAAQQKEPVKGPGQLLKEAREAKNLTQRDVADRLRLRLQIIELLEADDYDSFSTPTFIKGYLRSYAKLLDTNDEEIFAAYKKLGIKEPDTTAMQSFSRRVKHQESDNRLMLITYAVIIVVIGLVIWWWQDSDISFNDISNDVEQAVQEQPQKRVEPSSEQQQPATTTQPRDQDQVLESEVSASDTSTALSSNDPSANDDATQQESAPQTVSDTDPADTILEEVNTPAAADNTAEMPAESAAASDSETASDTTDEQPQTVTDDTATDSVLSEVNSDAETTETEQSQAVEPSLVFEFSEECWVKVDDASGETQAVGIKAAGYTMPVPGEAPFSVTICKPEAATITYQGQALDLSNFRQARVARFNVPLTN